MPSYDAEKLRSIALVLENDGVFYQKYHVCHRANQAKDFRNAIRDAKARLFVGSQNLNTNDYDIEQLRRYFHKRYGFLDPDTTGGGETTQLLAALPDFDFFDFVQQSADTTATNPPKEEPAMQKAIKITTKIFVGESDISQLADSTLFDMIAAQEASIKQLEAIENKPKKLIAEIAERKAGIQALVAQIDARP